MKKEKRHSTKKPGNIASKIDKYKPLTIRLAIFLSLIYLIIPVIIGLLRGGQRIYVQYNFYSFIPFTIGAIIMYIAFNRKTFLCYDQLPSKKQIILPVTTSVLALAAYFIIRFKLEHTPNNYPIMLISAGLFYLAAAFLLAIAIFGIQLFQKTWKSLAMVSIVTYIFFAFTELLDSLGTISSYGIARSSQFVLNALYTKATVQAGTGDPTLTLNDFSVLIGAPCSGIEGISMFTGFFLIMTAYRWRSIDLKKTTILFFTGTFAVYLLNTLRVSLIMIIGQEYPSFAKGIFHSQAGWILFAAFMLILIYTSKDWIVKEKRPSQEQSPNKRK